MTALLEIDYGGTRTKLVLRAVGGDGAAAGGEHGVPAAGENGVLAREEAATGDLPDLAAHVRSFIRGAGVQRFGISVAGTFDAATGVVGRSTNMPWLDGTAPAEVLAELVGIPGVAVQDGIATATAEATIGAGRGVEDVFVIALGTGIAGAHVVRGDVRAGAHGAAGEIGHLRVADEHRCSCGQTGCLAETGDSAAQRVLDRGTRALARTLLHVSALIDPGVLVFGGGLTRSPQWTVHPAVRIAADTATFHRLPQVRLAELGVWAGAHGALLHAAEVG